MVQRTGNRMKLSLIVPTLALAAFGLYAQQSMPRMTGVEPGNGKAGDVLTVSGEHLAKGEVVELYLTDEKKDTKVQVLEQAASTIKFKIPDKMATGRFALLVLTGGKDPKLIEQPVKVTVE